MPTKIVERAFGSISHRILDKARNPSDPCALPTNKYQAVVQQEIDNALASSYSYLSFKLDISNYRVPWVDNITINKRRVFEVKVDNHGKPHNSWYDYEAADNPELRSQAESQGRILPPAMPVNENNDLRFKPDDYRVIYLLNNEYRKNLFFIATLQIFSAMSIGILTLSLVIGSSIWRFKSASESRFAALYFGLTIVMVASILLLGIVFFNINPLLLSRITTLYWSITYTYYSLNVDTLSDSTIAEFWGIGGANLLDTLMSVMVVLAIRFATMDGDFTQELLDMFLNPPARLKAWKAVKLIAMPFLVSSLIACALPFVLVAFSMRQNDGFPIDSFVRVLKFESISLLAHHCMIVLSAIAVAAITWALVKLYKKIHKHVKSRVYLENQELVNYSQ
ncbi:hypothetical protein BX070DRAFT_253987 [Coemansia spiralis]|nr:hypothetical protein BX070DRAFT_253987 [Coemansia spiralis]